MIELYTGVPGSGKSLHAVKTIKECIHDGRPCIGNFAINYKACNPKGNGGYWYIRNEDLEPEILIYFSIKFQNEILKKRIPEDHIMLIIDEAQLLFNAREWNKSDRKYWNEFFTLHRKLGYHIILIAQYNEMIDKQVRAIIEYEYNHRKVANIGKSGKFVDAITGGGLHVAVKTYLPLKMRVGSELYHAEKSLYAIYDTYARF